MGQGVILLVLIESREEKIFRYSVSSTVMVKKYGMWVDLYSYIRQNMKRFDDQQISRDGKSLQNSTGKTSSLKNLGTKYVQKMLKNLQINCKTTKNFTQKNQKSFKNCVEKKLAQL